MITFTGCSTPQESPPVVYSDATLPFVLPEGIFYQDKIYWKSDVDTQEEINGQELIGCNKRKCITRRISNK